MRLRFLLIGLIVALLHLSCAGGPPARDIASDGASRRISAVHLKTADVGKYGSAIFNPYVPMMNLLSKNDQAVFYVYAVRFPPAANIRTELVSASIADQAGIEIAQGLSLSDMRTYWSTYSFSQDDTDAMEETLFRTYLDDRALKHSTRKTLERVYVFQGVVPRVETPKAVFVFRTNGTEVRVEGR